MKPYLEMDKVTVYCGDCREVLPGIGQVDAVVTDPPYGLGFMGKDWDAGVPGVGFWQLVAGAMKPGAHLLAFGGTRTFHRLTCAIEDAGLEIRDCVMWLYGSGFPKSLDVSKAIDKAAGSDRERVPGGVNTKSGQTYTGQGGYVAGEAISDRPVTDAAKQWDGWGTALKPAYEPIILARKPLDGTVAANVLAHGVGGLNIDGARIQSSDVWNPSTRKPSDSIGTFKTKTRTTEQHAQGRWPANVIHDGSDEVTGLFPDSDAGPRQDAMTPRRHAGSVQFGYSENRHQFTIGDGGSASRFFYCAKASRSERGRSNIHPTVKPISLMRYLCKLITPPGGLVLDPFMGSGSTLVAAREDGFRSIGIELNEDYCKMITKRLEQGLLDFGSVEGGD